MNFRARIKNTEAIMNDAMVRLRIAQRKGEPERVEIHGVWNWITSISELNAKTGYVSRIKI